MSLKNLLLTSFLAPALVLGIAAPATAQPVIQYNSQIATGLSNPIDIVNAGDASNRLFIVQRGGTIRVYNQALGYIRDFLTVTGIGTGGEGGLLSAAFHPDYETNGFLFVYYTLPDLSLEIARYHVSSNPDSADVASRQVVLNIPHPTNTNHNGGRLQFGTDGYLYLGTGDGGGGGDVPNNAQNGNSLLGKMLRLNVSTGTTAPFYTIPPTNPYITDAAVRDEIWDIGLRNPWRWSFDRSNGDMWLADVGQDAFEEVNYRPAAATGGINFGWRCYEGTTAYNTTGCLAASNYTAPIFTYGHNNATGGFSITGGHVYRGPDYPGLNGYYICADYVTGNQWTIGSNGAGGWNVFQQNSASFPGNIVTYGEAENGTLYAASLSGNAIYKIELSTVLPLTLAAFSGEYTNNRSSLDWKTAMEKELDRFEVEYSNDGVHYDYAGTVTAKNTAAGAAYHFDHYMLIEGRLLYRLKMIDKDGQFRYSNIISLNGSSAAENIVYPTVIRDGQLQLLIRNEIKELRVADINGAVVLRKDMNGSTGKVLVALGSLPQGMYFVQLEGKDGKMVKKIILQ